MEKQADSISTVDMKEYPPSVESYANSVQEAPPAYRRAEKSPAVQVAKIIAVTVVAVTILLGTFLVLAAWIQARASCVTVEVGLPLPHHPLLSTSGSLPPPFQLDEPLPMEHHHMGLPEAHRLYQEDPRDFEDSAQHRDNNVQEEHKTHEAPMTPPPAAASSGEEVTQVLRLPLQLTFDDMAGHLIENNMRARMNCLVEKKKAEEIVDEQAKTVALPLGVNLTTDPRYLHFTGEKMAIVCESGHDQSKPMEMAPAEVLMPPPPPHQMPSYPHPHQHSQGPQPHPHPHLHLHSNAHPQHQEDEPHMQAQELHLPLHALPPLRPLHALPLALPLPLHPPQAPHLPPFHQHHHQHQHQQQQHQQQGHEQPEIIVVAEKRSGMMSPLLGTAFHARSLPQPISLPLREIPDFHPHYIRPRSVDSSGEHKREKRVKRCSCNCSC